LLIKPKILIMDEATAYLDAGAEKKLKATLQALMMGKTVIVVSHRLSTVHDADKIISLDKAGIQYDGPAAPFFQKQQGTVQ